MTAQITAIHVLQQLKEIIERLTDEQFSRPILNLSHSSLAQHTRHTLEFFQCLEAGIISGCIDYDKRERNQQLENSRGFTIETISSLQRSIQQQTSNKELLLDICYGTEDLLSQTVATNYYRELIYNIEHAVHHMAIFKIGLREVAPELNIPDDFGVASSTLRYQQSIQAAS